RFAVVGSSASPFKFAADVLSGLGGEAAVDPLSALSARSGRPVPAPLAGLEGRRVRFADVAAPADMIKAVDGFLK
ncbi:MAG: threonine synthase, partial [Oscillospiraceae bacterium]|nr:threonine synthase [Oscillospiraceae bacterium]